MLTEKEARTKWCPHARLGDEDGATFNRRWDNKVHEATVCLASDCAMWRWRYIPKPRSSKTKVEGWDYLDGDESGEGVEMWIEPEESLQARRRGYCGLAGKTDNG